MLSNELSLVADTGTTVARRFEEQAHRTVYIFNGHTPLKPNHMTLYRSFAEKRGTDLGQEKRRVKFTETVKTVDAAGNEVSKPLIIELSISTPVGQESAAVNIARKKVVGYINSDAFSAQVQLGEI